LFNNALELKQTNKRHLFIFRKIFKFLNHNSLGFIVKFLQGFIVNNVSNKRMLIKKRKEKRACELHYMNTAMKCHSFDAFQKCARYI